MTSRIPCTLLLLVPLLCLASLGQLQAAQYKDPVWKQVTPHQTPDAATRAAEKAARKEAIQAHIAELKARLKTTPPADKMKELHGKLQAIHDDYA